MSFDPDIQKRIQAWQRPPFDEKTRTAVKELAEKDPKAAVDAFYTTLSFGTGGLRGIMGPGTNRMNRYTVRMAAQGLANYLLKQFGKASVAIGFDSRNHSEEFAWETAKQLAANKIFVYFIQKLRPTPFISFVLREKKCQAGVMITASHNPAIYNGFKVYWEDGGQIVPPHDKGIIDEVNKITDLASIPQTADVERYITEIDSSFDERYFQAIDSLQLFPEENHKEGHTLRITFTSLHGTGMTLTPPALKNWGFTSINFVEHQIVPDGNFPTVHFPNPEFKETLKLGIEQLVASQSDLLLATDPDADRLGVVVMHENEPHILTGNQIAALATHYLCSVLSQKKTLPQNGAFVTTIVSTDMIRRIADSYKMACFEVLTGFKYIAEKIHEWEREKDGYRFLFGAEESCGFLIGTHTRDKDAVVSSCLIAEMALFAKKKGKTLIDLLYEVYQIYGLFLEKQLSVNFEATKEGMDRIKHLMRRLRQDLPKTFCNQNVEVLEDYQLRMRHNLKKGGSEPLTLPPSDVLLFRLADQSKVVIRPSGTEPKIKIYAGVRRSGFTSLPQAWKEADQKLDKLLDSAKKDLGSDNQRS
ncbi:MAG: phosphomannomutase [Chlamydiae bacterium GWC2_50_10]|nr:MAG: phosphomannomutase [Chlamydiae bacterium GWC2_50_10]HCJ84769.1 phospho-sugar mutase [Parachlamydiales bacterium]